MKEIDRFYQLAIEFCDYIKENEITYESIDYLISTVMRLYIAALEFPEVETEDKLSSEAELDIESIRINKDLPEAYLEIFNPFKDEEMVGGSLIDDLSDIIRDLKEAFMSMMPGG